MNISNWIYKHACFSPTKVALRFRDEAINYLELFNRIKQSAQVLKHSFGVSRGDRIALLSYNCPEYLILLFACARLGAMLVPLNWRLAVPEQLFILKDAGAKVLFVEEAFEDIIQPLSEELPTCSVVGLDFSPPAGGSLDLLLSRANGDSDNPHVELDTPLLIVYTSGTTGHPKGAVLTQNALFYNALNSIHMHDMTSQDHILTVLPLFHVGGLNIQTTPALYCGATVTLHERFHPDAALQSIERDKPTMTVLVPATIQACIASGFWEDIDLSSLRLLTTGSTTVPEQLTDTFSDRGVPVLEVYGLTETCPIAIYQRLDSDFSKRGTTGQAALHCESKVVHDDESDCAPDEVGELLIKGPSILFEYWGNEEATNGAIKDGWFFTGDIGFKDKEGYTFIKDRKKNLIISGGENIYPAEVERVLLEHPNVKECAVIGIAHERWQEIPMAIVCADCTEEELRAFITNKLAKFKQPKQYMFVEALPKNVMGKVQHFKLREDYR